MSSLLIILLGSVLVSYFALTTRGIVQPFASDDVFDSAVGVAIATAVGLTLLSPLAWLIDRLALRPLHMDFLAPTLFVMLTVLFALCLEALFRHQTHWLPLRMGFTMLLTTQGALLGVMLQGRVRSDTLLQAVLAGAGTGIGFAALLLAFASMQQRQRAAEVPAAFQLAPIALITIGIMALALMGLTGLVRE